MFGRYLVYIVFSKDIAFLPCISTELLVYPIKEQKTIFFWLLCILSWKIAVFSKQFWWPWIWKNVFVKWFIYSCTSSKNDSMAFYSFYLFLIQTLFICCKLFYINFDDNLFDDNLYILAFVCLRTQRNWYVKTHTKFILLELDFCRYYT